MYNKYFVIICYLYVQFDAFVMSVADGVASDNNLKLYIVTRDVCTHIA